MQPATGAVRFASISLGTVLVLVAARMAVHRPGQSRPPFAKLLRFATAICARFALLRRSDDTSLALRLAVAPRSWPARATAAAARDRSSPAADPTLCAFMPGLRLISGVAAAILGAAVALPLGPPAVAAGAAFGAAAGGVLPEVSLRRAARSALRPSARPVAPALDVLGAAVATGLPLRDAVGLAAGHAAPPVAAALRGAAIRLATGDHPRAAFAGEADRFGLPTLRDVGDAADRHHSLGAPLGPELHRLAARQRAEDRARLLEHAARRGPLATVIVAAVIAPICLAALAACVVGGLIQSGGLGLH